MSVFEAGEGLGYEVYSLPAAEESLNGKEDEEVIHCRGQLITKVQLSPSTVDISATHVRLSNEKSGEECYALFRELGLDYGSTFQGIETLYYSKGEALSKLSLPMEEGFVLPPGLLDSALQTCMGLGLATQEKTLFLPFSVKEVTLYGEVHQACWAYARRSDSSQERAAIPSYDIDLLSDAGEILISFKDFVTLPVDGFQQKEQETPRLQYYAPHWKERAVVPVQDATSSETLMVLAGGSASLAEALTDRLICEVIALEASTEMDYYLKLQELVQKCLVGKVSTHLTVLYRAKEAVRYIFISGLLRTAQLEHPGFSGKVIAIERLSLQALDTLSEIISSEQADRSLEVRYLGDKREVKEVFPIEVTSTSNLLIKAGRVYLITGGAGGLGERFAEHIAQTEDTKLILTGRQEQSPLSKEALASLHATYYSCDVTDQGAIATLIKEILDTHGRLDGIIHSAGVIKDRFLVKKTPEEAEAVLSPKIKGVQHLDKATKELDLAFMVYCSSVAGVLGNVGQADYASANAFMDAYAYYRNKLVNEGKRQGKTLSINWPLWQEGGMQVDAESEHYLERTWGMRGLPTQEGMEAFAALLQQDRAQGMVMYGQPSKLKKVLSSAVRKEKSATAASSSSDSHSPIASRLLSLTASLLKLEEAHLDLDTDFSEYGVDSILMMKILNEIETAFGLTVEPTALVNYPTITLLANHLQAQVGAGVLPAPEKPKAVKEAHSKRAFPTLSKRKRRTKGWGAVPVSSGKVAIIGMSCRLPGSENVEVFWEHLRSGTDLITETPKERWDAAAYYAASGGADKTYTTKGGFISGAGWFDAQYFGVSDADALGMDPQQRLTLELARALWAHAGYAKEEVEGSNTGVYIGAKDNNYVKNHYHLLPEAAYQHTIVNNISNMIAARVSDFYHLTGPSQIIDTACSSSLVAIHQACEDVLLGKVPLAIAGGISIMV
ncbi:MAG: SDR family NAD(P)-dependent oxidoreductase, partial [Verrucomicrobiota bacterium]